LVLCIVVCNCLLLFHATNKRYSPISDYRENSVRTSGGIILTTYFVSQQDPQRKSFIQSDDYSYIQPLYESAQQHGIPLLIFHDSLSSSFIEQYTTHLIQFHKVELRSTISMNDERFLFYQDYVRKNNLSEKFKYIILSDVSDVVFYRNPFDEFDKQQEIRKMEKSETCKLWVLNEQARLMEMLPAMKDCYSIRSNFVNMNFDSRSIIYNAGVMGGPVNEMLNLMDAIIRELTRMDRGKSNCNMAALQYVLPREYNLDLICTTGMCWKEQPCVADPFVHHKPPVGK